LWIVCGQPWITFFKLFDVHNPNIFSPKAVEKFHLEISREKPLFHISPPPTTITTYYPILPSCEGEKDWRTT
jgi:hypothetical protein